MSDEPDEEDLEVPLWIPGEGLDERLIARVVAEVQKGNFRYIAFGRFGVPKTTWSDWLKRGNKELRERNIGDLSKYARLVQELASADSYVHSRCVQDILASDDPRVKMEFLRRKYGKLYSMSPSAVDDETGEESKIDMGARLLELLRAIRGDDESG